jgi:hypothetical protein
VDLETLLDNRRWLKSEDPFPHFLAGEVLVSDAYETMEQEFRDLLDRGLASEPGTAGRFAPNGDDAAYELRLGSDYAGAFEPFLSKVWQDVLAQLFELESVGPLEVSLRHRTAGCSDGAIHHGFCGSAEGDDPDESVPAVAMIYHLANPTYQGGGEIGLYRTRDQELHNPSLAVPPENNSLLVFEYTPYALRAFHGGPRPCNALHLVLHRPRADAVARWGEEVGS